MITTTADRIQKQIVLRAARERVWRAIITPAEFAQWFGVEFEGSFTPGARIQMKSTIPECEGEVFYVTVDRMEPGRLFAWRWHPGAVRPEVDYSKEPTTLVTFELEDTPEGTRLTITETGFDAISLERRARVYEENRGGWDYQAGALERHVTAG